MSEQDLECRSCGGSSKQKMDEIELGGSLGGKTKKEKEKTTDLPALSLKDRDFFQLQVGIE